MTELQYNDIKHRLNAIADELFELVKPTKEELEDARATIADGSIDDIDSYADVEWHIGKINMLLTVIDNRDMLEEDAAIDRLIDSAQN